MSTKPLSVNKFRLIFTGWWIIWAGVQVIVLNWLGFSVSIALTDGIVTNLLLAAACVVVSNNFQYYLPGKESYGYILVLSSVLSALWLGAARFLLGVIAQGEPGYLLFLSRSLPVRFGIAFLLIGCMALISVVWYTLEEQKQNDQRKVEAEKLSKEAELYKLRQQLQPHFLFNSLNSISALIGSNPQMARTMIQQLSDFLRGTLKKEEQQWVSLSEELQYLELYLEIEKVRFGHRLSTIMKSDENSRSMKLPNMLLQPIVENAIKFGLYDTTGEITILIEAKAFDRQLHIVVQNPYDPETAPPLYGTGFGLSSIQRRLQLLFGRNDLLSTTTGNNIFNTIVKIPQHL